MKKILQALTIIAILIGLFYINRNKFFVYRVNESLPDIGYLKNHPKSPCCLDSITHDFSIPTDLDTSVYNWYYFYREMKSSRRVEQILFFSTNEMVSVNLSSGRIFDYCNPKYGARIFSKYELTTKDSTWMKDAIQRIEDRIDSLVLVYDKKCEGSRTYMEIYERRDDSIKQANKKQKGENNAQ